MKSLVGKNDKLQQTVSLLQRLPSFAAFGERPLTLLAKTGYLRKLAAEETVYLQGGPAVALYFVLEGSVGLFQTRRGGQTDRLRTVQTGNFFGESALFSEQPRLHGAKTLEQSLLLALFKSDFDHLSEAHPQAAMKILKRVAEKLFQELTVFQKEFHELSQKVAQDQLRQ